MASFSEAVASVSGRGGLVSSSEELAFRSRVYEACLWGNLSLSMCAIIESRYVGGPSYWDTRLTVCSASDKVCSRQMPGDVISPSTWKLIILVRGWKDHMGGKHGSWRGEGEWKINLQIQGSITSLGIIG